MKWVRHLARTGEIRYVYDLAVKKPEGEEDYRHEWEVNIKMNLAEFNGVNWFNPDQDREQ
jgi:hypothetical protein